MATITPKELAIELGCTPKVCRSFLRSTEGLDRKVGKGHRWAIEKREVRGLKARFAKWDLDRKNAIAERAKANAETANAVLEAADADEVDENEVLEIDEVDEVEMLELEAGDENDA